MSFQDYLRSEIEGLPLRARALEPGECRSQDGMPCGLCDGMKLEYSVEMELKQRALSAFLLKNLPSVPADPLVGSPRGRAYRTVSKRKLFRTSAGIRLGLLGSASHPAPGGIPVLRCAIEPEDHARIYAHHEAALQNPWSAPLQESLTYVVLKGDYRSVTVIWNVRSVTPAVIRAANTLSKSLTGKFGNRIAGLFLYRGDDSGRYYLGSRDPAGRQEIRKIFGRPEIPARVEQQLFLFPPLAFSQVNGSMLDTFVSGARTLLGVRRTETLYDLYCGYGLFALSIGRSARQVIGVEASRLSVASARENARRLRAGNCRFIAADIQQETVQTVMAGRSGPAVAILDPPRNGTAEGVIEAIAHERPARVLHIFCNSSLIVPDLGRWQRQGYSPVRIRPFDMFPGTRELETMVLLEANRQGI